MNTIPPRSETEALLFEKFQSLLADLDTAGDNAQYGHVLDEMDDFLFTVIRKLAAETLEKKIQEHINAAEQTDAAKQCPHCKKKTEVRKTRTKTLTTSNNHITISRRHRRCNSCRQYSFPVESLLGLDKDYTRGARRLIAFAVAKSSYETAAFQLKEFGCITVSHQTVSNLVPSLSDEVQSKLANNAGVRKVFQEAKGDTEFTADGAFVHIRSGRYTLPDGVQSRGFCEAGARQECIASRVGQP